MRYICYMGKEGKEKYRTQPTKQKPLVVNGTFDDLIKASVSGNPKPKPKPVKPKKKK